MILDTIDVLNANYRWSPMTKITKYKLTHSDPRPTKHLLHSPQQWEGGGPRALANPVI